MYDMLTGFEWKKLLKIDDLVQKETSETLTARTFTLANAIFAS
jgi:hypothetical protein